MDDDVHNGYFYVCPSFLLSLILTGTLMRTTGATELSKSAMTYDAGPPCVGFVWVVFGAIRTPKLSPFEPHSVPARKKKVKTHISRFFNVHL